MRVIVGFTYCCNEDIYIGVYKDESSFFKYFTDKGDEIIDINRKTLERLDFGLDCTFKTRNGALVTNYGYILTEIK